MRQKRRYCRSCKAKTLHARNVLGTGWGLLLTLFTAGLFLPVWFLLSVFGAIFIPDRCQQCGGAKVL